MFQVTAPQQPLGQNQPAAGRGGSWLALYVPWPAWVQERAAAIEVTTTCTTTTTRAAGMRPTMMAKMITLQPQRLQSQHLAAGSTRGVAASGTASRCSSTTRRGRQQESSAGHLFRYAWLQAQFRRIMLHFAFLEQKTDNMAYWERKT